MKIRLIQKNDFYGVYELWQKAKLKLDTYQNEKREFADCNEL